MSIFNDIHFEFNGFRILWKWQNVYIPKLIFHRMQLSIEIHSPAHAVFPEKCIKGESFFRSHVNLSILKENQLEQ